MRHGHIILFGALGLVACDEPAPGTVGAACPNDRNCINPLKCIEGICQMGPDQPMPDAGPMDTGVNMNPDTGVMPDAGPPPMVDAFASGSFIKTPDGMTLMTDIIGRAGVIREEGGYTSVLLFVTGGEADTEYPVHLHESTCDDMIGGGHYKIDPTEMDTVEANEVWPALTTNTDGDGWAYARVNHYVREGEGGAIVIHQPTTNERILCATMLDDADVTARGTFVELTAGMGSGITGEATLRRYSGGTKVEVTIMGALQGGEAYPVHVHKQRCNDDEAGGHYQIDQSVMDVDQANEIWPGVTANAAGTMGFGEAETQHIARYDALAVVVHDPATGDKLLCANLEWQ